MPDVYLIAMPYAAIERPSPGLGILKACLMQQKVSVRVCYANILFAEQIGLRNYFFFSNSFSAVLMGEWTFSGAAFPDFKPDASRYLQACQARGISEKFLRGIKEKSALFIEQIAQQVLEARPKIVGCSTMFQQHCASLAVLRRIKTLCPDVVTMLGGSNCEGDMGYATHQYFPWVDYVVSGDAELILPDLCRRIFEYGHDIPQEHIPEGVYSPASRTHKSAVRSVRPAILHDLDLSPIPVYDDYFETLQASSIADQVKSGLVFETSRGCWWGQKTHCVFCGVNGSRMGFRVKSPQRILNEMEVLSQTYHLKNFLGTDSILDTGHFDTVFPQLTKAGKEYCIQFETSANLTRSQVKQLAEAGVRWINPGIENLHDRLLRLLRKGTNTCKNVQLLKWGMEYGVFVSWVFLVNIPGESIEWYREIMEWLPLIYHLQPPIKQVFLHYDRFSPCYQYPEYFQLRLEPSWFYSQIYPLNSRQLSEIAYYFDDVSEDNMQALQQKLSVFESIQSLIDTWHDLFYTPRKDIVRKDVSENRPMLTMQQHDGQLMLKDTRPCAGVSEIVLEGMAQEIYMACDSALTAEMLVNHLQQNNARPVSWPQIAPIVEQLRAQKILLQLHDRFLSLAVREPHSALLSHDEYAGGLLLIPRLTK